MRLIDAHKLWDVMNKATLHHIMTNTLWNTLKSVVENAPTIDAVEVVRCKDCKYMTEHYDTNGNAPYWTCSEWDSGTDYDGFCHYGERREP